MNTTVLYTLVNCTEIIVIALLVVNAAVIFVNMHTVSILAICVLAWNGRTIIRRIAAIRFFAVGAGSLVAPGWNLADINRTDLAVIAHSGVGTTARLQIIVALTVLTGISSAGVRVYAIQI